MNEKEKGQNTFTEDELLEKINRYLDECIEDEDTSRQTEITSADETKEDTPDRLVSLLNYYYDRNDFEKVRELCHENESNPAAVYYIGKLFNKENRFEEAYKVFTGSDFSKVTDKKMLSSIKSEKGKSYLAMNYMEEAKGFFKESLDLNPDNTMAVLGLASMDFLDFNYGLAINKYNTILESNEDNILAVLGKANVYRVVGKIDEAITCYNKALRMDEESIDAINGLLRCSYVKRDFDDIENAVQNYLELHQADLNMQFVAASIYYEQKKFDNALKCLETISVFDSNYPGIDELRLKINTEMRS